MFSFKRWSLTAVMFCSMTVIAGGYNQGAACHTDSCVEVPEHPVEINEVDKSFFVAKKAQYVSLQLGMPYANKITKNSEEITGVNGIGVSVYLGMQFNRMIGPEIGFNYNRYNKLNSETYITSAALRGEIHFNEQISGFAKVGVGAGTISACSSGCSQKTYFVPVFGAGLGWSVMYDWMISAEFNAAYFKDSPDMNARGTVGLLSLGLTRFIEW